MSDYDDDKDKSNADFIRDVELFARNILRKSDDSNISGEDKLKRRGVNLKKNNLVHQKLKNSPFYESWEEWMKTKQKMKDSGQDLAVSYKWEEGKQKATNNDEKKDKYDMKLHLQSSYLRERFRCDQVLIRKNSEISLDDTNDGLNAVNMHPLYESLLKNIDLMSNRFKAITKKRLESVQRKTDIHSCWMVYRDGLCRYISRNKGKEGDVNVNDVNLDLLLGENSQIQSVPLDRAKQGTFRRSKIQQILSRKEFCRSDESKSAESKYDKSNSDLTSEEEEYFANCSHLKLTPECWPLFLHENICYGNYNISILKMKRRDSEEPNDDSKEYWVVDVFENFKLQRRFILLTSEVKSIIQSTQIQKSDITEHDKARKCVHRQVMSIEDEEFKLTLTGNCTVCIYTDEHKVIIAMIRIEFEDTESHYGLSCTAPLEIQFPVYEIMARLQYTYLCKAFDEKFWLSERNGDFIWEPFMKRMDFNVSEIMTTKGIQHLQVGLTWLKEYDKDKVDEDTVHWIQPSAVDTHEYYSSLKLAFDLLLRVNSIFALNDTINLDKLGGFDCMQQTRDDLISVMEQDMDNVPPLSLRLLGKRALSKTLIPGVCTIGQKGKWQTEDSIEDDREYRDDLTQAVAYFDRDEGRNGVPSTKVKTLLAFEKHVPTPVFHEWDPTQIIPLNIKSNDDKLTIPTVMARGDSIFKEKFDSVIEKWLPSPIMICDEPSTIGDKKWSLEHKDWTNKEDDVFQTNGFRVKCQAHPFQYDSEIPRRTYGISHNASSPNKTDVNDRLRWSSKEYCDYLLSEERGPEDFFHLLQNEYTDKDGGSVNQPLVSVIHMSGYKIKHVEGIKLDKYLEDKKQLMEKKELEKKRRKLYEKISGADDILAKREHNIIHGINCNVEDSEEALENVSSCRLGPPNDDDRVLPLPNNIVTTNDTIPPQQPHDSNTAELKGYQWRKLPKPILGANFFELNKHKIQTCIRGDLFDRCNTPRTIGIVNASANIDYKIDESLFEVKPEVLIIKDIVSDRMNISKSIKDRQIGRDKLLSSNQEEALDYILNIPLMKSEKNERHEKTSFDDNIQEEEKYQDRMEASVVDNSIFMKEKRDKDNLNDKVVVAVKHSNYDTLTEIIDEKGVEVDTYDDFGNTLFIIACQQGNRKMCKFLLRRGAFINAQNHAGNTALHYLYEYGHVNLAEYLIEKGADDTYLNSEGLTCYEGVKRKNLEEL